MTFSSSADSAPQGDSPSVAGQIVSRLAWPLLVFSGTLMAYFLATDANMCQVCPPKPLVSALPWAVAGGLFVLALQTWCARRAPV